MRTSKEALRLLEDQPGAFDICLKDHDPPRTSACRLLRLMAASSRALPPVIGASRPQALHSGQIFRARCNPAGLTVSAAQFASQW